MPRQRRHSTSAIHSTHKSAIRSVIAASIIIATGSSTPARAEVLDASPSGFTTRHSITVAGAPGDVYRAAVARVGEWWSDGHTVSGQAANMYIDARTQGCFCERLGERAGVVHMTVTFVSPGAMLRFNGGLGPLGLMGVSGNMTWEFDDSESGTTVTWLYAVGGYHKDGLERIASAVDSVLVEQMERLKAFAEGRAGGE